MSNQTLNPVETLALNKLLTPDQIKDARKLVPAGDHEANIFLSASVSFKKSEDGTRVGTARIPYKAVISLLLDKLNSVTGESVLSLLEDAISQAHEVGDGNAGAKVIEDNLTLDKGMKMLNETVAQVERIPTSGRITATRKQLVVSNLDNLSIQEVQDLNELLTRGGE